MAPEKAPSASERQEDWVQAAESGDVQRLKLLTQSEGEWIPADPIPQIVLCKAAAKNQEGTLKVLLDWGVPITAKDKSGHLLLHCAAGAGAVDVVRLLIKRKVDVHAQDAQGKNALGPALRGHHLAVMKELLRAGVAMPTGQKELPLGAHAVMKEVQLEKQMKEIKGFPTEDKTLTERLGEADKQVWKHQLAHMQLLERQEEIKVAKVVHDFDERLRSAEADASEGSKVEAALAKELSEIKVLVQQEQMKQDQVIAEIQQSQASQDSQKGEEEALQKEIEKRQEELDKLTSELTAEKDELAKAEAERDGHLATCQTLTDEIQTSKISHQSLVAELGEAKKELELLRRDRRRIAELQAEANELHEKVDDNND